MLLAIFSAILVSTDFKILKFGVFGKLYFVIMAPEINQSKKESLEHLIEDFRLKYYSKYYHEATNNKELKVIKIDDDSILLNASGVSQYLKRGMKFKIYKIDSLEIPESQETIEVPSMELGMGEVEHVAEKYAKLNVKWKKYKPNTSIDEAKLVAVVYIDDDTIHSDADDLRQVYDVLKRIYISKWG